MLIPLTWTPVGAEQAARHQHEDELAVLSTHEQRVWRHGTAITAAMCAYVSILVVVAVTHTLTSYWELKSVIKQCRIQ